MDSGGGRACFDVVPRHRNRASHTHALNACFAWSRKGETQVVCVPAFWRRTKDIACGGEEHGDREESFTRMCFWSLLKPGASLLHQSWGE